MKRSLRMLLLCTIALSFSLVSYAQTYTTYKGKQVVGNSIIVKYDKNVNAKINGKQINAGIKAADLKRQHKIRVSNSFKTSKTEVWEFNGSIDKMLQIARSIPGAVASPNYVYSLPKVEKEHVTTEQLEKLTTRNKTKQSSDWKTIKTNPATKGRSGVSSNSSQLKSSINKHLQGSKKTIPVQFEGIQLGDAVWAEDFEDSTSIVDIWSIYTENEAGSAWNYVNEEGNRFFFIGDIENNYLPSSESYVVSPYLDLSSLSTDFGYELNINYAAALEEGWDFFEVSVGYDETIVASFDLSSEDGVSYLASFDISSLAGKDGVFIQFAFISDDAFQTGFGAMFDDISIVATEKPITNDPFLSLQYALNNDGNFGNNSTEGADIDAFRAWDYTTGADTVLVVVYDTGTDLNHPDLAENLWHNPNEIPDNGIDDDGNGYIDDIYGWDAFYNTNTPQDGDGHGSHVAGIIGAVGNNGVGISGINQTVKIITVRIFNEDGQTSGEAILLGYEYITSLLENGNRIVAINQSWGGGVDYNDPDAEAIVASFKDVAAVHDYYNAIWVVSAGNSALDHDRMTYQRYPDPIQFPNVISVASTDMFDELSYFSDFGRRTVEIGAPGSKILSTVVDGYDYYSGTSMASPYVTGTIALAASLYDESASSRIARVMSTADPIPSLTETTISGNRLNAFNAVSSASAQNDIRASANPAMGLFNRIDQTAAFSVGFTNTLGTPLTITSLAITGEDASSFALGAELVGTLDIAAGEAFGVGVFVTRDEDIDSYNATLTIGLSGGSTIEIPLDVATQATPILTVDNLEENKGIVDFGTPISSTFTIGNEGKGELNFEVLQGLFVNEETEPLKTSYKPNLSKRNVKKRSLYDVAKTDFAKVKLSIANSPRKTVKLTKNGAFTKKHGSLLAEDSEYYYFEDLNDAVSVLENWTIQNFGEGDEWSLLNISETEETDNVFFIGDLDNGYQNNTLSVAASPIFDFSEIYTTGESPYFLSFDYAAELEDDYDFFYVNVVQAGNRIATIALTGRDLVNDGNMYRAVVDISPLLGMSDIEFWFIANFDEENSAGFGAMFDNIGIVTGPAPFYASATDGVIPEGGTQEIQVDVRTELIGTGRYVLATAIFSDAINDIQGYGEGVIEHLVFFGSTYNSFVSITPPYIEIEDISKLETELTGSFEVTNSGIVDLNYFGYSFIQPDFNGPDLLKRNAFFGTDRVTALSKSKEAVLNQKKLVKERKKQSLSDIVSRLKSNFKRPKANISKKPVQNAYTPKLSKQKSWLKNKGKTSIQETEQYFFEDFNSSLETPDGWYFMDISENGFSWNVTNIYPEDNVLAFGDLENEEYGDDTFALAFSPYFNLSEVADNIGVTLEFEYASLMESGYDIFAVFIGTDEDPLAYHLASSEDMLNNDGDFNFAQMDLSNFNGMDQDLFITFLGSSDGYYGYGYALVDNVALYQTELISYLSPRKGELVSGSTIEVSYNVNLGYLDPGSYSVLNAIMYKNEDTRVFGAAFNRLDFNITNEPPIASNDTLAVIAGDIVDLPTILAAILSNDTDLDDEFLYVETVTDPVYGTWKDLALNKPWWWDGPTHYVAPLNYDGLDGFQYVVSDGYATDTATVYIKVMAAPRFVTGVQQQFTFLEDDSLTINTLKMAAGVGGMNKSLRVWARTNNPELKIKPIPVHRMQISANENYFGQAISMFYVGDDEAIYDSLRVTLVIAPVNDFPVAKFDFVINDNTVAFNDLSNDVFDPNGAIISWSWDFGDGNTSTEKSPTHIFGAVNKYNVVLTVTDNEGANAQFTSEVDVKVFTSVEPELVPNSFELFQNYPNPFNPSTSIKFAVPGTQKVTIEVFNIVGQKVATLINAKSYNAGFHTLNFDASNLSSGTYLYRIQSIDANGLLQSNTKKMVLIK